MQPTEIIKPFLAPTLLQILTLLTMAIFEYKWRGGELGGGLVGGKSSEMKNVELESSVPYKLFLFAPVEKKNR